MLLVLFTSFCAASAFRLRAIWNPSICLELADQEAPTGDDLIAGSNLRWALHKCDHSVHAGTVYQRFSLDRTTGQIHIAGYKDTTGNGVADPKRVVLEYTKKNEPIRFKLDDVSNDVQDTWDCYRHLIFHDNASTKTKSFMRYPDLEEPSKDVPYPWAVWGEGGEFGDSEILFEEDQHGRIFTADEEVCPLAPGKSYIGGKDTYTDIYEADRDTVNIVDALAVKPYIVFIMLNGIGFHDIGLTNTESRTPNIDFLLNTGLKMTKYYTYNSGAPSRASFLSGREPAFSKWQKNDMLSLHMNTLPYALKQAGYQTWMLGKWDTGFARRDHTPNGRGFDYSFCSFGEAGLWEQRASSEEICRCLDQCEKQDNNKNKQLGLIDSPVGLWENWAPAFGLNGTYTDDMVFKKAVDLIKDHGENKIPWFLYLAPHTPGTTADIHKDYFDRLEHVPDTRRRIHLAQVSYLDDRIGDILAEIRKNLSVYRKMMVVTVSSSGASEEYGNNYPLRGGMGSDTEGGIRTFASFTAGTDILSKNRRGKTIDGYVHVSDWYKTMSSLAGISQTDPVAAVTGERPVDGYDMWPYLRGDVTESPRTKIYLAPYSDNGGRPDGIGFIEGDYKYIYGRFRVGRRSVYFSPDGDDQPKIQNLDCYTNGGCLFNIKNDPEETTDLRTDPDEAEKFARMQEHSRNVAASGQIRYTETVDLQPINNEQACKKVEENGGYWGPYVQDLAEENLES